MTKVSERLLGVAITLFGSADVICDCLASLKASRGVELRVVLVDNASPDDSCEVVRRWAAANLDPAEFAEAGLGEISRADRWLTLIRAPKNGGFAYGTNRAIELLLADDAIDLFWALNPDCVVAPDAAALYCEAGADGNFALMGSRTFYLDQPEMIQSEGGYVSRLTGRCIPANQGARAGEVQSPNPARIQYISGANMVASRRFIERAGPMDEGYFLYYEEVDWAQRRDTLPLRLAPGVQVYHKVGSAIGSAAEGRRASAFAHYYNYRSRMRFMHRHHLFAWPLAWKFAWLKAAQLALIGNRQGARAIIAAIMGMRPPAPNAPRLN